MDWTRHTAHFNPLGAASRASDGLNILYLPIYIENIHIYIWIGRGNGATLPSPMRECRTAALNGEGRYIPCWNTATTTPLDRYNATSYIICPAFLPPIVYIMQKLNANMQ